MHACREIRTCLLNEGEHCTSQWFCEFQDSAVSERKEQGHFLGKIYTHFGHYQTIKFSLKN